jgi:hypothetical protein
LEQRLARTQISGLSKRFDRDASDVVHDVRTSFGRVISGLPQRIQRATELCEALGLSTKLGWQVWRLTTDPNPLLAARFLPGSAGVKLFLKAAARAGVARDAIESARTAAKRVGDLVSVHAGGRESLEMMLTHAGGAPDEESSETYREFSFRGNSFIYGVRAAAHLSTLYIQPSNTGGGVDIAMVSGLVGWRRLRSNVSWAVGRIGFTDPTGETRYHPGREPLCPADEDATTRDGAAAGLPHESGSPGESPLLRPPIIPEFCQPRSPGLRQRVLDGEVEIELPEGPVGTTSAVTVISGETMRGVGSRYRRPGDEAAHLNAHVRTPCDVLIHDLIVRTDTFGRLSPTADVFAEPDGMVSTWQRRDARHRLPIQTKVDYLGRGPAVTQAVEIPRYPELARYVFDRLGWDGGQFDVYRVRMRYPVMNSAVVLHVDLPEEPNETGIA